MTLLKAGSVVGGKYELVRLLGEGGMGSVWRCRHRQLGAPFAIKFLNPDLASARSRKRFELEAKAAAGLRTRHVVRIYDHGVEEQPYIVMELLEGEDLGARMSRLGRLSLGAVAAIAVQTSRGLHHAHEAGIVHRDLKPANIFLARGDGEEEVKIVDFGLAKLVGPARVGDQTKPGQLIGTVPYMSPEHAQGQWEKFDARADLWSLAVILYRAVTGRLPFEASGPAEVIAKICAAQPPPPSARDRSLPQELDAFFARALALRPEDRFASAHELARAFVVAAGQTEPSWSRSTELSGDDEVTHVLEPARLAAAEDETLGPTAASRPDVSPPPALAMSADPTTIPLEEVGGEPEEPAPASPAAIRSARPRPAPRRQAPLLAVVVAAVAGIAALAVVLVLRDEPLEPLRAGAYARPVGPLPVPAIAADTAHPAPSSDQAASTASAAARPPPSADPSTQQRPPTTRPPPPPSTDFGY